MYQTTNRRHFLKQAAGSALAGVISTSTAQTIVAQTSDTSSKNFKNTRLKKSLILHSFPESLSVADRFKLSAEAGIEGMEIPTTRDPKELEAIQS
ncbi:MAG: twin-arginine translocation signal domain-containing protein, partial [Planctomycetota bacterium]